MPRGSTALAGALAASAAVLGLLAPGAQASSRRAAPKPRPLPSLTLPASALGGPVQVTMPPVGLSIEYPVIASMLGSGACAPAVLGSELARLGSPPLRLGGASEDLTAPTGASAQAPAQWEAAVLYQLPEGFWSRLGCLLATTHDPVTVGLNARTGTLAWAQQMVSEARAAVPTPLSFSIGNEPDLYYLPDYSSLATHLQDEALDVHTYLGVASALAPALGGEPLLGPDLARPERWRASLPGVLTTLGEKVLGVHLYPLSMCSDPRAVTTAGVLSPAAGEAPARLSWVVADADAVGIPAIISEANSASCGGRPGVSDAPAAAVWAVRFTLSALASGFREVRFHMSGGAYDPFELDGTRLVRRPIEYALAALAKWVPSGAVLTTLAAPAHVRAYALTGPPGTAAELIENYGSQPLHLRLALSSAATLQELDAVHDGISVSPLPAGPARTVVLPAQSSAAIVPG